MTSNSSLFLFFTSLAFNVGDNEFCYKFFSCLLGLHSFNFAKGFQWFNKDIELRAAYFDT